MENPAVWAGIFLATAVGFAIAEIVLPSSFYLLPFAIGALVASVVSLFGAPPVISFPTFLVASFLVFLSFRPLARRLDATVPDVAGIGANRLIGTTGTVTQAIPGEHGPAGMVRVGAEEWRDDTVADQPLPVGARIRVREVRGTRLVVEPVDSFLPPVSTGFPEPSPEPSRDS